MTLLTMLIGAVFAQDFHEGSYRYRIFGEVVPNKAWIVQGLNGLYECKATIGCPGLKKDMIIRSRKPTRYDPLIIHYVVDYKVRSCELKSCYYVPDLTYDYNR